MKDLAILVDNKNDSTEAQDLLFSMGYKWRGLGEISKSYFYPKMNKYFIFMNKNEMDLQMAGYFAGSSRSYAESRFKEITLPQLRDIVVLNRNDVGDATHIDKIGEPWLVSGNNEFYSWADSGWMQESENVVLNYNPKPIEKTMKEYLRKNSNDTYSYIGTVRPENISSNVIEIPEGCNIITCENRKGNLVYFHWKSLDSDEFFLKDEKIWSNNFNETLSDFIEKNEGDVVIIWSRHTHPEELPFIDDEPIKRMKAQDEAVSIPKSELDKFGISVSLNDQYAEIEKVRQSAWQKQEGGSHYKNLKIQPMQYALENKLDYAQANVVKYVTRHKEKNGKEDLLKAIHNIELMIEFYYGGGE